MGELGKLLKELRGKKSLRESAKKAGISHNYLLIIEKGIDPRSGSPVRPSPETLKRLAHAYNYPYIKLMETAGYIQDGKDLNEAKKVTEKQNTNPSESNQTYIKGIPLTDEEVEKYDDLLDWIIKEKLSNYNKGEDKNE